ncbi:Fip1-domain-containing protein [Basidiobolus meristosporus CBS 931.73]|uniref:Fip1-domain-containing protein n=1 Tax=Basidiobolus meristosporus CBS 931.73 TaxID=1314790 RepID=A0A1Y1ZAZ0_9FUNG|nr:Fip1-domain-containing protein [Basidiobolus meristosporus CBS 931.73]|eukprot:ORY07483.1 Fip1-domain-containing protein [Basidiobolus meristosporus CBS 931.73]
MEEDDLDDFLYGDSAKGTITGSGQNQNNEDDYYELYGGKEDASVNTLPGDEQHKIDIDNNVVDDDVDYGDDAEEENQDATKNEEEEDNNDEEEDDDNDEDSDSDIEFVTEMPEDENHDGEGRRNSLVNIKPNQYQKNANSSATNQDGTQQATAANRPGGIDLNAVGEIEGQSIFEVDLDSFEDKPWRKPGADLTDYFNYGFNEYTWRLYCSKQKQMREDQFLRKRINVYESKPDMMGEMPPDMPPFGPPMFDMPPHGPGPFRFPPSPAQRMMRRPGEPEESSAIQVVSSDRENMGENEMPGRMRPDFMNPERFPNNFPVPPPMPMGMFPPDMVPPGAMPPSLFMGGPDMGPPGPLVYDPGFRGGRGRGMIRPNQPMIRGTLRGRGRGNMSPKDEKLSNSNEEHHSREGEMNNNPNMSNKMPGMNRGPGGPHNPGMMRERNAPPSGRSGGFESNDSTGGDGRRSSQASDRTADHGDDDRHDKHFKDDRERNRDRDRSDRHRDKSSRDKDSKDRWSKRDDSRSKDNTRDSGRDSRDNDRDRHDDRGSRDSKSNRKRAYDSRDDDDGHRRSSSKRRH